MTRSSRGMAAFPRRGVAALSVGAMVLAACSGSDSSSEDTVVTDPPTTVEETTTTSSTTTSSTTTTTVEETTTTEAPVIETIPDPEDTTPDETTTTESAPDPSIPVDTMFDPATVEGQIEQVVLADNEAYKQCLRELPNCDVIGATRFGALEYAEGTAEFLTEFNERGVVASNVGSITLAVEEIRFGESQSEAEVIFCWVDDSRLVVPSAGDSPEEVVEEGFVSLRRQVLVQNIGQWLITGSLTLQGEDGEENNLCE